MSKYMLSDYNALNHINPFVTDGPGGWRTPYGFSPPDVNKDPLPMWANNPELPGCMWGITTADSSSWLKESCLPSKNSVSCVMNRPLEPTQEFIPDLYTLVPKTVPIPAAYVPREQQPIILLILLIFILFIAKNAM